MARATLAGPIARVRELAAINTPGGTADYTDDAVEAVLDRNRLDFADDRLTPLRETDAGGTVRYYVHLSRFRNLEATDGGTAVLYVRDAAGARVGAASYGVDMDAGRVSFVADTAGTVYYLTGRSYDVYAAAAEVWRQKAAQAAERFDFAADGASFKGSQVIDHCWKMAEYCGGLATFGAGAGGLRTTTMVRDDVETWR